MKKNRLLFIVVILFLAGIIIFFVYNYSLQRQTANYQVYSTEAECKLGTGKTCRFSTCDYKCTGPYGYFKGWIPEN